MQTKENGIFLAVIMFFVLSPSPALGLDKIRIGLSSVSALHGAVWVAEEKGLFKKHGMEPEVIVIGGGAARGVSALIAGDIQFLSGAGDAVINANLRGADVIIAASVLNKGVQRVMARTELKSPGDLKGKKVGITRFGSASHLVLGLMLRRWGMSPAEVNVVQVGSSPAMIASLEKGGIDAAVLTIPSVFVAEERGYRVLADLADMDIYYLHTMLDTTRSYLRAHRDQAARFMKAFVEGIAYFKKNKKESVEVLKKKLRTDQEGEKYLEKSYDLLASRYYERVPYPSLKGVETVLEFLGKENPKARGADPKSFMDDSIVREIEASGFIKRLYE
jgi:NitT/TauT family transport system substrate-binding protein